MDLEERARRSMEAGNVWDSEIMREARAHVEQSLVAGFRAVPLRDTEGLMRVRLLMELHKAYESFFKAALEDGTMARIEIEHKKSMRERIRSVI